MLGRNDNRLCFARTRPSPAAAACQYQFNASQTITILESVYGDSPTVPACSILAAVWNCRAAHNQQQNTPGQNNVVSKSWFTLYQDTYSWLTGVWTQDDSSGAEEIVRWCRYLDNPLIITHGNSGVEAAEAAPVTT